MGPILRGHATLMEMYGTCEGGNPDGNVVHCLGWFHIIMPPERCILNHGTLVVNLGEDVWEPC